jgi:hypothetical protein
MPKPRPLGTRQLEWLILLSSVERIAITTDAVSDGLVKRGLLREDKGGICISGAGLRALADEIDAGRLQDALARMAIEAAERRQKAGNA